MHVLKCLKIMIHTEIYMQSKGGRGQLSLPHKIYDKYCVYHTVNSSSVQVSADTDSALHRVVHKD